MKNKFLLPVLAVVVGISFLAGPLWAKEETQAVLSQKCDQAKLKKIAGDAAIKIEKGSWAGGYNITLNTDKMTFNDLLQKMAKEGCN